MLSHDKLSLTLTQRHIVQMGAVCSRGFIAVRVVSGIEFLYQYYLPRDKHHHGPWFNHYSLSKPFAIQVHIVLQTDNVPLCRVYRTLSHCSAFMSFCLLQLFLQCLLMQLCCSGYSVCAALLIKNIGYSVYMLIDTRDTSATQRPFNEEDQVEQGMTCYYN